MTQLAFEGDGWDWPDPPPGCRWWRVVTPETGRVLPGGCVLGHKLIFALSVESAGAIAAERGYVVLSIEDDSQPREQTT